MLWSLVAAALLQPGEPETFRIYDQRTGETVCIEALADELSQRDVVFLGEEHGNSAGHRLQLQIIEELHKHRPDLVVSLEMFERDVQGTLDDYLRGRIDEETFLKHARPWTRYETDYRPIVEFARERQLDVIAANVPRRIAQLVSRGEEPSRADRAFLPRETTAPRDAYRERFAEVMQGHGGTDDADGLERYYRAQCLKDDGMAESIVDYLETRPHRRPLVVHLCGRFHSDYGHGAVLRVLMRRPLLHVGVVSMELVEDVEEFDPAEQRDRSHYLLVVPASEVRGKEEATENGLQDVES
jgi:uncharacterized iron-regulated protein